ncbi:hypothetical protein LAJ19_08490 [Deinococcus taeanensis]|uniref:beta strand repeat-containing protein n=1 Tax=Deinococcus taeanensis TaxID=2737050 RepID=UPI001CDD89E6|nr:hypothetical protein [Deinococcus taeanensis]UBV41689.1 hypothetical protein LAJ19_08490 [Deinococcus taeanensis]
MTALSVGAAHALVAQPVAPSTPTAAGTLITNTATATFNDETNTPVPGPNGGPPSTSNTVTSTVQAVPAFTITPNTVDRTPVSAIPGAYVTFNKYTLANTGNVNGDSYAVNSGALDLTTISGKTVQTPGTVYYFTHQPAGPELTSPGTNGGQTSLSFTNVDPGSTKDFWVVYQIPTTATDGSVYSSNPVGHRNTNTSIPNNVTDGSAPDDTNNQNEANITRNDSFSVGPNGFAPGNAPAGTQDTTTSPGYTIVASGDNQTGTVNVNAGQTTLTFTETLQNTGSRTDSYALATKLSGFPAGTTVKYYLSGTELTSATGITIDGTSYPAVTNVAAGATVNFTVQLTLGSVTAPITTTPVATVQVTSQNSTAAAGGAGGLKGTPDTTTDTLNVRAAAFGDYLGNVLSTTPTQAQNVTPSTSGPTDVKYTMAVSNFGTITETYVPTTAGTTINQVVIPVVTSTGSVNATPTPTPVRFYLADVNGEPTGPELNSTNPLSVPASSTVTVIGVVSVPSTAAAMNTPLSFVQQLLSSTASPTGVPAGTAVTTLTDGTYTISGTTYGVPNSDQFTVKSSGTLQMSGPAGTGKTVVNCGKLLTDCATANTEVTTNDVKPGDYLKYTIRAKNTRNGAVNTVILQDILNANVNFVSLNAALLDGLGSTVTGLPANFAYRYAAAGSSVGTAAWAQLGTGFSNSFDTTGAPMVVSAGSTLQIAVDSANAQNVIDTDDTVSAMHTVVVTIIVRVK